MKRDTSFTSQILLEMKSNDFWTSPWQQLRLINHYSASRFHESHIKFTFYSNRQSLTTEGALFEFCVTILPPLHPHPHVSTLWWALFLSRLFLFMVRGSWLTWFPCGAHERDRARTRKRKSHLESCHLNFISSSDPEKIQRTKTKQNKYSGKQPLFHRRNLPRIFRKLLIHFHQN